MNLKNTLIIAFLGLFALPSLAQTLTVTGRVVDEEHIPMFGASVWVKGTKRGAVADFDGNFSIEVSVGEVLEFSFLGYEKIERTIKEDTKRINITLKEEETETLCDIPGAPRLMFPAAPGVREYWENLPYQGQNIYSRDYRELPTVQLTDVLEGRALSFNASTSTIRGGKVLYVVDGIPISQNADDIAYLTPQNIQQIEVLPGASAAALYGGETSNGAVVITTKIRKNWEAKRNFSSATGVYSNGKTIAQNAISLYMGNNDEHQTYLSATSLQSGRENQFSPYERYQLFARHNSYIGRTGLNLDLSGGYSHQNQQTLVAPENFYAFSGALTYRNWSDFNVGTHFRLDNRSLPSEKLSYYTDVLLNYLCYLDYGFLLHSHLGTSYERDKTAVFGLTSLEYDEKAYLYFSARRDFPTVSSANTLYWRPTIGASVLPHHIFKKLQKKRNKKLTNSKLRGAYTWGEDSSYEIGFETEWWSRFFCDATLYRTSLEDTSLLNNRLQTEGAEMRIGGVYYYKQYTWRNKFITSFNEKEIGTSWRLGWQTYMSDNNWQLTALLTSNTTQLHLQELSLSYNLRGLLDVAYFLNVSLYHSAPPSTPKNTGLMLKIHF